jgi:hypothetical protein
MSTLTHPVSLHLTDYTHVAIIALTRTKELKFHWPPTPHCKRLPLQLTSRTSISDCLTFPTPTVIRSPPPPNPDFFHNLQVAASYTSLSCDQQKKETPEGHAGSLSRIWFDEMFILNLLFRLQGTSASKGFVQYQMTE